MSPGLGSNFLVESDILPRSLSWLKIITCKAFSFDLLQVEQACVQAILAWHVYAIIIQNTHSDMQLLCKGIYACSIHSQATIHAALLASNQESTGCTVVSHASPQDSMSEGLP